MRFITHSGTFHADEVFATAILRIVHDDAAGTKHPVLRVRDASVARPGDIVYDIGHGPLDHHQKGGNGARRNGVPYAACGLVWRKYGPSACSCDDVFHLVDKALIQGIDAVDAGHEPVKGPADAVPHMDVSTLVAMYNPVWDSKYQDDPGYADGRFDEAVRLALEILAKTIETAEANVRARAAADAAIAASDGGVMAMDRYCPWEARVFTSTDPKAAGLLYAVYPSNRGGWNWQAVPDAPGSFGMRNRCPESWRGLEGKALEAACGVPGATFCHAAGFIGGCETREGAIAMARLAIERGSRAPGASESRP